ncbi:histidine kinase [Kineosporia sp. NBRC 101677]|uniref:sensor histidine kinase n=1 Tax=Kineosporia sp. NBRC 101677 TaxID=3032197 RepID=UPI002552359E|nr:histidine kinase [Kineosporia sp. NBRC 101677]
MTLYERIRRRRASGPWLLGPVLALMLAGDLIVADNLDLPRKWWVVPGALLLCLCALWVGRAPVRAAVAATVVLVGGSEALRLLEVQVLTANGALLAAEITALSFLVMVLTRQTDSATAVRTLLVVLLSCAATNFLRPQFGFLPADPWWQDYVENGLVLSAAAGVGRFLRHWDAERAGLLRSAVAAARQRERLGMARELHDVVAHHVGGMVVQAQAAQQVSGTDPGATARMLPGIESSGQEALRAMRQVVATLRESDPEGVTHISTTTSDLIADLRAVASTPGPEVCLTMDLTEQIPAPVAASVLRVVQESVINARRHARDAGRIEVFVRSGDGVVRLRVRDDGRGQDQPGQTGSGYGLIGMRERIGLLNGHFAAGPLEGGGWQVAAEVPLC